ncbi:MAG TPA: TGS domain-containing protein, partial [Armatimonadetes bacterium]|nr:TGS domain-containing protein [Armatimonadota bacterium]
MSKEQIQIVLPDGSVREYERGVSLATLAADLGPDWAQRALVAQVNGRLVDLTAPLTENAEVRFLTFEDPEGQEVYRHSTAHIMAQAVQDLFPEAKVTIGPPIEDG